MSHGMAGWAQLGLGPHQKETIQVKKYDCSFFVEPLVWPLYLPDPHMAQSPSPIRPARRFRSRGIRPGGNEETGHHWHPFTPGHGGQDGIQRVTPFPSRNLALLLYNDPVISQHAICQTCLYHSPVPCSDLTNP